MNGRQGDRILQPVGDVDAPTREGELLKVGGEDGEAPYFVRWADGFLCPEPCSGPQVEAEPAHSGIAAVILLSDIRSRRAQRP